MPKQVFIAWINFQRRAESMQAFFGYSLHYVPPPFARNWLKPIGYMFQAWQTARIIERERAEVVWIQMPPTFLLHFLALTQLLTGRRFAVIADCHNRVFRRPWSRMPGLVRQLNRTGAVLAHNAEVAQTAQALGVDPSKLLVFETRPAQLQLPTEQPPPSGMPEILVPCSFNPDEPIETLIAAARYAPDIRFLVTGNVAKAQARGFTKGAPENICFTGFLSKADYERLLFTATVVLGLTELEGIQLSVANEAVGAGKAMVLSDTAILRDLFGTAALFALNEPVALAAACREAVVRASELDARSVMLRQTREVRWRGQADMVATMISRSRTDRVVMGKDGRG
jgi:glycosyltransferase involved in cell wall biosynthesis